MVRAIGKVTPAVSKWRKTNPLRLWLNKPPKQQKLKAFAKKIGITKSAIFAWMYGISSPTLDSFKKLTRITGITPEQWEKWQDANPAK